jgi:5'-3' exonuclease
MPAPATVHLVDASPYIFRAFFSLPSSLTDPEGRSVNAVYGFAGFLLRLIAEERPTHLGLAFDGSLTTSFRNDFYPAYKAQRELPPAELEAQLDDCRELGAAFGAATFVDRRYEADDLIGTLAHQLGAEEQSVVVVSSDKDLAQLVGERCELFDFARERRYRAPEVVEKFGVRPEQVADLLALAGDPVDNIPGVRGIGGKTAAALLGHFESLEALYENLDAVAELRLRGARSIRTRLQAGREDAEISKRLSVIAKDAPVKADIDRLEFRGADPALVESLFERLGFERLRDRIERWAPGQNGRGSPSSSVFSR